MATSVDSTKAELVWSADGASVTKRLVRHHDDPIMGSLRVAFRNEIRVNRMLLAAPPPVTTPRLLAASPRELQLVVEAVDGRPLGPKYPTTLATTDLDDLLALVARLDRYRPTRRWFRRFSLSHRLTVHVGEGLLTAAQATGIARFADRARPRWQFAHGDLTARNVLRDGLGQLVLIDWEWAGTYPLGYDRAFLWFSLVDRTDDRLSVERTVPSHQRDGFLLSALMIQLLHLHLWVGRPPTSFVANHHATLARLLAEVGA